MMFLHFHRFEHGQQEKGTVAMNGVCKYCFCLLNHVVACGVLEFLLNYNRIPRRSIGAVIRSFETHAETLDFGLL
uniref:Uncharacterized protein n=1 Tax=Rhizophora mucronata TaxID=61149 RepID=A0A2P2P4I0_RHIMU